MVVEDPSRVTVLLIGVIAPAPIAYPDTASVHSFTPLPGVGADLDWYSAFFREIVPPLKLRLIRPKSPAKTGAAALKEQIRSAFTGLQEGELLVLVLCGHGFQVRDLNGDERQDRLDEAFATSAGLILDDFFDAVWKTETTVRAGAVAIVDTCHSDTLAMRMAMEVSPPVIHEDAGIPRLQLSASETWQKAFETTSAEKPRGYLSKSLQEVWENVPSARQSYRTLFEETAKLTALSSPQAPRIRYYGPAADATFLDAAPFGYRAATDHGPGPATDVSAKVAGPGAESTSARQMTEPVDQLDGLDPDRRRAQLRAVLGHLGAGSDLRPPVRYAVGSHTRIGARSFGYWGLELLDTASITIGDDVLIGPNVHLLTTDPDHPARAAAPIVIGDHVQLGAGVIVHPGITIGAGTVVGANSVVTDDLPAGVLAVGSPARIVAPTPSNRPARTSQRRRANSDPQVDSGGDH